MNLLTKKFGRLLVTARLDFVKGSGVYWVCHCDCGKQCVRRTGQLRDKSNPNKSCGCARSESIAKASAAAIAKTTKFSHPHKRKLKVMRGNMLKRCYNPTSNRYERYGGRGITICEEWRNNPTAFYQWAVAAGYAPGLSIERINPDGNYCPENCRFATQVEQANNTKRNRFLTWNGKTLTVSQWAAELNISARILQHRVDRGWEVARIFTQPIRGK